MGEEKKPHWWSSTHDVSWSKLKGAIVDEWHKAAAGAGKLEKNVAERAIAFGHGAQEVYGKASAHAGQWTSEIEAKLKADWEQTHKDATNTWDKVRDAVKHGFEKTAGDKKA